jgi:hypothetical protein
MSMSNMFLVKYVISTKGRNLLRYALTQVH